MTHLYFTGFDCLGCRAAYAPDQDLLLCPRQPSGAVTVAAVRLAEAERI